MLVQLLGRVYHKCMETPTPERYVPLVYPSEKQPRYVDKIFDDPDFIRLSLVDKKNFQVSWATSGNGVHSLELLSEFIDESDFDSGTIALKQTYQRPNTIGGFNELEGEAEEIINEVKDAGDRVIGFSLRSRTLELFFRPSWPRTYYNLQTNEIALDMNRKAKTARHITSKAISLTAMNELGASTEETLDQLARYLPVLKA